MLKNIPSIGDTLFVLDVDRSVVEETCPDCLGKRTWHVVLPNGEEYDFGCARCSRGFEGSGGYVRERYLNEVRAVPMRVTSVEARAEGELRVNGRDAREVFPDRESAESVIPERVRDLQRAEDEDVARQVRNAARRKPRRPYPDGQHDHDGAVASELHSVAYARSQVRRAVEEIDRWLDFAARKGIVIRSPLAPRKS